MVACQWVWTPGIQAEHNGALDWVGGRLQSKRGWGERTKQAEKSIDATMMMSVGRSDGPLELRLRPQLFCTSN